MNRWYAIRSDGVVGESIVGACDKHIAISPNYCCCLKMCGIFAYVNYLVEKDRKYIVDTLLAGLQRLEYRGYDSAGIPPNTLKYLTYYAADASIRRHGR